MKIWKLFLAFAFVGVVSAGVSVGVYDYLNKRNANGNAAGVFNQPARLAAIAGSAAENTDFTQAAENSVHAVVHIKSTTKTRGQRYVDPFEFLFGPGSGGFQRPEPQPRTGFGSGVIISTDGYIVTNNHVIEGADEISVTLNDNKSYTAKLVGADPETDIALIKIEAKDLPVIFFGDSEKLRVGEWVLAVGNPFNLTSTVTAGIVSAKGRGNVFPNTGGSKPRMKIESFIQTDAAVNPGNSGGALVNTKGELVGINTAIYSETGNFAGYSFAIPISIVSKVATDLKQHGAVQRAILGVTIQDISVLQQSKPDVAEKLKVTEGAYVEDFTERSSAKEAGIEAGDVITAVNDVKIKSVSQLQEQISLYRPGDKVKVTVQRGNDKKVITVSLKNRQGNADVIKTSSAAELLGAAFSPLKESALKQYGISYGIQVSGVTAGKFKDAGISKGYIIILVNDQKIASPEEFDSIVDKLLKTSSDDKVLFIKGFYPNGRTKYYAVDLTE
ncbi:MAG: Do family serine endopeptidase [Dysgonamonadaceae bacterium]|nr:Do family serine endopeptidase [Dysgonamonadaceae bacterium]